MLGFAEVDRSKLALVGGKGASLGELSRIGGIQVPEGFCVTTEAYREIVGKNSEINALISQLAHLGVQDSGPATELSALIRHRIETLAITDDLREEIAQHLAGLGAANAYAVRSSATAEDLPLASFAGQQDTFLNIQGEQAVLQHIIRCWSSLFTYRAVTYRIRNGFDHRKIYLSVVVQRMVFPQVAGVLFTADPVTSNRKLISINAIFGLGEALVSGFANADLFQVYEGKIVERKSGAKKASFYAAKHGGTERHTIGPDQSDAPTLTEREIMRLEWLGRQIEAHFACPQDIEWCLSDGNFYIVQSRPITTLFPIPKVKDGKTHVFLSVGHLQMMTDAIKPLGISLLMLSEFPFTQSNPAGGRLFIDITHDLASRIGRTLLLSLVGESDTLVRSALSNLVRRRRFMRTLSRGRRAATSAGMYLPIIWPSIKTYLTNDPTFIPSLIRRYQTSVHSLQERLSRLSGIDVFDHIVRDQKELNAIMYDPQGMGPLVVGVYARNWLNKNLEQWLGEKNAADTLSKSVANNVASEMGLDLLAVSDVVRQCRAAIEYLEHAADDTFFEGLEDLPGGDAVSASIRAYLKRYGMRGSGEIDITRPRWGERPTMLVPTILSNVRNVEPNAGHARFEEGRSIAERKEQELLRRLEQLPGGKRKARKTKKMISALRNFSGYREYPKYFFMCRYQAYKDALMKESAAMVQKGIIREQEDAFYLSVAEFREAVNGGKIDCDMIRKRKEEYAVFKSMSPPRVMTSDGEVIFGDHKIGAIPPRALPGTPVSPGVVEGRARVVQRMEDALVEADDILVTMFTDPSWTPLFVSVKGLVTEVGGLMTHGAVVAREYGLPAVVGVEKATKLIRDGQRIRVNGAEGYVEVL